LQKSPAQGAQPPAAMPPDPVTLHPTPFPHSPLRNPGYATGKIALTQTQFEFWNKSTKLL